MGDVKVTYSEPALSRALSQFLAPRMVQAVLEQLRHEHGLGKATPPASKVTDADMARARRLLRRAGVRVDE